MAVKKKRTKAQRSAAAKASWERRRAAQLKKSIFTETVTVKELMSPGYSMPVLNDREKTHGSFLDTAAIAQGIKEVMGRPGHGTFAPLRKSLSLDQQESLDLIATKIARILSGNANEREHWLDIAGYATLIADRLKG